LLLQLIHRAQALLVLPFASVMKLFEFTNEWVTQVRGDLPSDG
jgi:hypothetical protein